MYSFSTINCSVRINNETYGLFLKGDFRSFFFYSNDSINFKTCVFMAVY